MTLLEQRIAKLTPAQRELLERKITKMNNKNENSKILLTLQEGDRLKRRPVYCMHTHLGVTGFYLNVVRHFGREQPVIGVQSPAFYGIREAFNNMEDMAAYYLDAIRSVQPDPPYFFIGLSNSAYIIYEMALQIDNPDHVPVIAFIDSTAPIGPQEALMDTLKVPNLVENDEAMYLTAWLVSLAHDKELTFTLEELKEKPSTEDKHNMLADFLKGAGFLPVNSDTSMVSVLLQMVANHVIADSKYHEKHTPHGSMKKYEGRSVLLRCTKETVWEGSDVVSPVDNSEFSGWEKFCSGPIDVIGIPDATHLTMVMEPCVKSVAEHIQAYIDQVTPY